MKVAYIILAYQYPEQLLRLVNKLAAPDIVFIIHIDKKVDIEVFKSALSKSISKNITFVKREKSNWGGCGCVKATLNCIEEAIDQKNVGYLYFLSGQDYPIESNRYLSEFTHKNINKIYMDFSELPKKGWRFGGFDRIQYYHLDRFKDKRMALRAHEAILLLRSILPKRKFPNYLKPYGGEFYFSFPVYAAKYILKFLDQHPDYLQFHKYTWIPEEIFFQTILLNSKDKKIKDNIVNDNLRYIDWSRPPYPAVLITDDFDKISNSKKLFARKFDMKVDNNILNIIDKKIAL